MKTNKSIDTRLVNAFQSGDKQALTKLVKRWHLSFCEKAYWIVKDADLSKDIAQESWQIIIKKIDTLNDTKRFGSWALRIVYSKSLDHLRAQSRERNRLKELANEQNIISEDQEENDALKKQLLKAINKLPQLQQMVLKLFYVEDYSLKEISELLNISTGTVKSRLFHAREKLKQQLKKQTNEN